MVKFTHASEMKTCNDFSEKFWSLIIKEAADSDKLRIKFHRYATLSVKRAKREKKRLKYYKFTKFISTQREVTM